MSHTTDNDDDPSTYRGIFAFELDFGGTLGCIPMSVRMRLDQEGIKLSLQQWNRMQSRDRRQLVEMACEGPDEIDRYRRYLVSLLEAQADTTVEYVPLESSPPWADAALVPERVCAWAREVGIAPPSPEQWTRLTTLQRFTLYKLTRPGHANDNFIPAMREFSL